MKRLRTLLTAALSALAFAVSLPAANISGVSIIDGAASIAWFVGSQSAPPLTVTDPGSGSNPKLDDTILTGSGISDGTYLIFIDTAWDPYWQQSTPPDATINLRLDYTDASYRTADFSYPGTLAGPATWTRTNGDTGLSLGTPGAYTDSAYGNIVLTFTSSSTTVGAAPEPGTILLGAAGLVGVLVARKRLG